MIKLFIMRHGEASFEAQTDSARTLTECGHQEASAAAMWLKPSTPVLSMSIVSPYVRARQTWEEVNALLHADQCLTVNWLTPQANVELAMNSLQAELLEQSEGATVMLVSHMPLVCHLVDSICQGQSPLFATASIVTIDVDPHTMQGTITGHYHG